MTEEIAYNYYIPMRPGCQQDEFSISTSKYYSCAAKNS